jgi:hypothetical protein
MSASVCGTFAGTLRESTPCCTSSHMQRDQCFCFEKPPHAATQGRSLTTTQCQICSH